jgi:hypothetical protein
MYHKEHPQAVLEAIKEVGLEVNTGRIKYRSVPPECSTIPLCERGNIVFQNFANCKHLTAIVTNQNGM